MNETKANEKQFLTCERTWVYFALIFSAGVWGAYTYLLRGHIFCNAQTGNVVLLGLALGERHWEQAGYYLVPISAYILGAMVSELAPNPIKHRLRVRWDTLLILLEMAAVLVLGLLPDTLPVQIFQVAINFLASMQYNTFRQAEGVPVATTFVTNHIRQVGIGLAKEWHHRHRSDKSHRPRMVRHFGMLSFFLLGVVAGAVCCQLAGGRAIWLSLLPLGAVFGALLHADLTTERDRVEQKPAGH